MIDLENLDDKTPLEIFNESVQKIKHINPKWTYKELSDPGITLIELFSWLKADQHKYLNRVSNVLKVKILKLLGLSLDKRRGSKTLLHISNLKKSLVVVCYLASNLACHFWRYSLRLIPFGPPV